MENQGRGVIAGMPGAVFAVILFWLAGLSHLCWAQGSEKILSLEEAYGLALKNDEKIHIAEIEMQKGRLLPKKALTILTPRMTVTGSYARLNDPIEFEAELGNIALPSVQTVPQEQTVGNFEYVQPIYEGEFFPARRQAAQAVELTAEGYSQTAQEIMFTVAQAYYEVLKGERLLQNANESVTMSQEELRVSESKLRAGAVTEDSVLMAELNLSRAQSSVIKAMNGLTMARDVLRDLLGMQDQPLRLLEPRKLVEESASYEEQLQKAMENRHDYKRSAIKVKMAESDVDLVKAKFHPRLEAAWDYYRVSDPSFSQEPEYWAAGIRLKIPLFEGGQNYLDLKEKKQSLQQAKLAVEDLRGNIELDVRGAMLKIHTQKALLTNATKQLQLAEQNYKIVFSKYHYGGATFSDLSEAHLRLDLAKTDFVTSTFDYQVSILNMQKATGLFAQAFVPRSGER